MKITDKSLVEQQKISETSLKQRLSLFRLTDSDLQEIRSLKTMINREIDGLVDTFYYHQTQIPEVESLIGDAGTLQRLMMAQRKYVMDLFSKEINLDYVEHRLRIGLVHKRIGVAPQLYLSAVNYLKETIFFTICKNIDDKQNADRLCTIINRLMDFDVSYVFDTYIRSMMHEIEFEKNKYFDYVGDLESLVARRTQSLEDMVRLDPLTNLYNKRAFEELVEPVFREAKTRNDPLTVVYIDVDDFKKFNDTYGHEDGDSVLIAVADSIRGISRSVDLCFRMGGDEFAIIMPRCGEKDANFTYVPRLWKQLHSIRNDISLSIGMCQTGPNDYISINSALSKADKDMYLDKRQDKNKENKRLVAVKANKSTGK
ncbi:diguanylate cyclase domain-containing protein [Vibrio neptunius]|uniref:Diguanylate cyclase DosC n=1 Tax=Vibrio neptunius TaxID=170651 RepID=A0ABS3A8H1_9VIBR|nr:diguanylate cyclase [Vibrio neptunius]MBN3495841.1 diguanylate cyclase [Vibrio neptunius]MBN3518257.1 diguanylate cyclase [Vibrio neptunius]MBN3552592.1 diguanylate cyclase [Vibrio neptunius]MBN3580653.1 diguanylate cyclase [Vibrio neptunius]MCH9874319.1 diguanylate cyclase [Vibrio neptunius]